MVVVNLFLESLHLMNIKIPSIFAAFFAGVCCVASAADAAKVMTVSSADKKLSFTLQLSEGWKTSAAKDGSTAIEVPMSGVHLQISALGNASVDEAAGQAPELIKGQVTKFKVTETKPITVAGTPGKLLTGTGEEEDDGDPSNADVYFFSVEGKVFMLCAHGEGDGSVKNRKLVAALLASVKKS
jgi:hypothetical protein